MPDRCFIALLSDRNTLLRERSGPRRGVGQYCGGHGYDENTATRHAPSGFGSDAPGRVGSFGTPIVPLRSHLTSHMAVPDRHLSRTCPFWPDLAGIVATSAVPPRSVMNSRRFNCSNCIRLPAIFGPICRISSGYTPHLRPLGGWRASRRVAVGTRISPRPPGHRRRSPASGSHRTWRADFPHHALRRLIYSCTARTCSAR